MVPDLRPRFPPEFFVGDRAAHLVPVAEVFDRRIQRNARHPRGVIQDVPHGDGLLSVGAELGPELDNRRLVAKQAALRQDMDNRRGRGLHDREAVKRRVRRHRTSAGRIGSARHGVDHQVGSTIYGHLQAALSAGIHELVDGGLYLLLGVGNDLAVVEYEGGIGCRLGLAHDSFLYRTSRVNDVIALTTASAGRTHRSAPMSSACSERLIQWT